MTSDQFSAWKDARTASIDDGNIAADDLMYYQNVGRDAVLDTLGLSIISEVI